MGAELEFDMGEMLVACGVLRLVGGRIVRGGGRTMSILE